MKAADFRPIIAELANITNAEQRKARAYSIECKLQSSAYRFEISLKEYSELSELIDLICSACSGTSGKGVS